jgi:hypothetical protein
MLLTRIANLMPVKLEAKRLRSDESGVALIAVIVLTLMGLLLGALILVAVVTSFGFTTASRANVQSQAAAQAGVTAAVASIQTTGNCTGVGGVYTSTVAPVYTAKVYVPNGSGGWTLGCPTSQTTQIRIDSTGTAATPAVAGQSHSNVANVEALYNLSGAGNAPTDGSIFNTGTDGNDGILAAGSSDKTWQVAGPYTPTDATTPIGSATPLSGYTTSTPSWKATTVGNQAPGQWAVSPYGNAQWIYLNDGSYLTGGDWYYRYQFSIANASTAAAFGLNLSFLADNTASEVWVNGVAQSSKTSGLPQNAPLPATQYTGATTDQSSVLNGTPPYNPYWYYGYKLAQAANTSLYSNWVVGTNSIIVEVKSYPNSEGFLSQIRTPDLGLCNAAYTPTIPAVTCSVPSLVYNRNVTKVP